MAGIGFELRRLLKKDSIFGIIRAYGYAGVISSGPWVLSILSVMLIGVLSIGQVIPKTLIVQYLISVTYLMAASLIITGPLQLMLTRFISDRLFEKRRQAVLPNLFGALLLTTLVTGTLGTGVTVILFKASFFYKLLIVASLTTLADIWMVVIFLSGMKSYHAILAVFAIGYGTAIIASLLLRAKGMEGLLAGFLIGQSVLLFTMLYLVARQYPGNALVSMEFLSPRKSYYSLAAAGLMFNLAIWADKFIFWSNPATSQPVIGPLRASIIYDLPIFLAYLSIIPGMAVFLVRMETDFVESYDNFYNAIRQGDTLKHIYLYKDAMVLNVKQGIYEIFKVQGLTVVLLFLASGLLMDTIGISRLYTRLFQVDMLGIGGQVLLLAILNVTFYLDLRGTACLLCAMFLGTNTFASWLSIRMGPHYFGVGFVTATILTSMVGLFLLDRRFKDLEFRTFMLQR
jgi:polysaccharide biosynthesis protein PelG